MTPEEKAKEIVDMYWEVECDDHWDNPFICHHMIKQIAIIHVNGIIESIPITPVIQNKFYENYADKIMDAITYWESVKIEINKL